MRSSVLVAMSGGVDSSVAAALLVDAGHEVVGVTMKMHDTPDARGSRHGCCTVEDADDAAAVAATLGIDHYTVDLSAPFRSHVVDAFVSGYAAGLTPNPCVECNRHIKFTELAARADALGIDLVATGHHARLRGGTLRRGMDAVKDQSYVLACLPPAVAHRVVLPVGELTKTRVREVAAGLGLRTARKPESMEVCFLGRDGAAGFLQRRTGTSPGPVLDEAGATVGTHRGALLYTVGQRRGLDTAGNQRCFVQSVDVTTNTVVVGPAPPRTDHFHAGSASWLTAAPSQLRCEVQTSAHGAAVPASLRVRGGEVAVDLDAAAPAPAPGQLAVFYQGDVVLGSATVAGASCVSGCTPPGSDVPGT